MADRRIHPGHIDTIGDMSDPRLVEIKKEITGLVACAFLAGCLITSFIFLLMADQVVAHSTPTLDTNERLKSSLITISDKLSEVKNEYHAAMETMKGMSANYDSKVNMILDHMQRCR